MVPTGPVCHTPGFYCRQNDVRVALFQSEAIIENDILLHFYMRAAVRRARVIVRPDAADGLSVLQRHRV